MTAFNRMFWLVLSGLLDLLLIGLPLAHGPEVPDRFDTSAKPAWRPGCSV